MALKNEINFSLWCDFIERDFLENQFKELIEQEIIYGATTNPAIFESTILNSVAYKQQLDMLQANPSKKIYEELAITDIKRASEILYPLYDKDSNDGFISLEVDPLLCDDEEETIKESVRLYNAIGGENVMIKVPATKAGYGAMKALTSQGINVNATLIFSPKQAIECAKALDEGIKQSNKDVKAVISIFVSRFDKMCDKELKNKKIPTSQLGIINATKCYHKINAFENKNIRTLFASTATKSEDLDPSYYVNNLIFPNSVNTVPLLTLEHWIMNGSKTQSKILSLDECNEFFKLLKSKNIGMDTIYRNLLNEGLDSFKNSFKDLLAKLIA